MNGAWDEPFASELRITSRTACSAKRNDMTQYRLLSLVSTSMDTPAPRAALGPVGAAERVETLDVLRGVALFGVFLMNMVGLISAGILSTESQLQALPTAALDHAVHQIEIWLFEDKANTLFTFLFGVGFSLQMQRAQARGADFVRIYRRRLTMLLLFGVFHLYFVWTWDVLHLYALAGFALLMLRGVSTRALFIGGVVLTLFDWRIPQQVLYHYGIDAALGLSATYTDEAVLARQAVSSAGDYFGTVRELALYLNGDYFLCGALLGWFVYALGRFMLGAWVGRRGWLERAYEFLPGFHRVLRWTLPSGLLLAAAELAILGHAENTGEDVWSHWFTVARAAHALSVPLLAAGYLCAIVVALHTERGHKLLAPFAHAGRMALSNYVAQSFVIGFVLFGIGPGLALAGRIGPAHLTLIVIVVYPVQIALSRWWLRRFRFGPLEWAWRGLTYGTFPEMRRTDAVSSARA